MTLLTVVFPLLENDLLPVIQLKVSVDMTPKIKVKKIIKKGINHFQKG